VNERELQDMVKKNSSNFKMSIENKTFKINKIDIFQTDNPITEPTTRGGVYFAEMKELKVQATILDTTISNHLSNAMLGPNKDFLDIILKAKMEGGDEISLITNLTNSMQDTSKIILYLILKDATVKSQ
jgi:hypothetical protein